MKFREGTVKVFLLGNVSGFFIVVVLVFGLALIKTVTNMEKMMPGYIGDVYVGIAEHPKKGYEWSVDVSRKENYLLKLSKRTDAEGVDRCTLFDLQGKMVVYMVWDDPEVYPGVMMHNGSSPIAVLAFKKDGSKSLIYGPYGAGSGKVHSGDVGYQDLDFDGQFDLKETFNEDGTFQKSFLSLNGDWKEIINIDRSKSKAEIQQGNQIIAYIFREGKGWSLEEPANRK